MAKKTLWKRVGNWLHWGTHPGDANEVVQYDAEGNLVDANGEGNENGNELNLSPLELRREQQLAAMEENFNRLVDVLGSMNENVIEHRKQSSELNSRMELVVDTLQSLPDITENQSAALKEIADELKSQSEVHKQVAESIQDLPEAARSQVEKLDSITQNLEISQELQARQAESFSHFDSSIQGMLENTEAQTLSLTNIGKMFEENEKQLHEMIQRQNRRFGWLMGIMLILGVAAVGAIGVLVWMMSKSS